MTHNTPFRSPRRVTITIPYTTYQCLLDRSEEQGRSFSNLAAYLLESSLLVERPADLDAPIRQRIRARSARATAATPQATMMMEPDVCLSRVWNGRSA